MAASAGACLVVSVGPGLLGPLASRFHGKLTWQRELISSRSVIVRMSASDSAVGSGGKHNVGNSRDGE